MRNNTMTQFRCRP